MRAIITIFIALFLVSGCGRNKVDPAYEALLTQESEVPESGELGAEDKFEIRVRNEPDLTGEYTVANDGSFTFHFLGRIEVLGKTCPQVAEIISSGLKEKYIKNPSVLCSITEYNSKRVFIFGQVKQPGSFAYKSNITIVEAMALAGGFAERADANFTKLSRKVNNTEIQVRVPVQDIVEGRSRNIKLLPGDIIYVPKVPY